MILEKIIFTTSQKKEILLKWKTLTHEELFLHLVENFNYNGSKKTMKRFLYNKKLFKTLPPLYWTEFETNYLLDNYKIKGNLEIANDLSSKNRIFTPKNVEKKMYCLKISRTKEQLKLIHLNHRKSGRYSDVCFKRWEFKKVKEGEKIVNINSSGNPMVLIKINGKLIPYARYRCIQLHGKLDSGIKVWFKDCNPLNVNDNNFELRKRPYNKEELIKYKRFCKDYLLKHKLIEPNSSKLLISNKKEKLKRLITVRVNSKTLIQVKPGTNIENVKKLYALNVK